MRDPIQYPDAPSSRPLMTAEEMLRLDFPNNRVELVRGALAVSEPPGFQHGLVTTRLAAVLCSHVWGRKLGEVLSGDAGFTLFRNPDTVRGPDIAFVRADRVPHPVPVGFAELAPDLVVEIVSPNDRPGEILAKAADWLEAGTKLVWVVDPGRTQAHIYRVDGTDALVDADGSLDGESVLPGFRCPLKQIL